jgi:predicted Zn-dependent protease
MVDQEHSDERIAQAVRHIQAGQRAEAREILRGIIAKDPDCEAAWLWMSVTVAGPDESALCLDNVLRINPKNEAAAMAYVRLKGQDMAREQLRAGYGLRRDTAQLLFWTLLVTTMALVMWSPWA